MQFHVLFLHHDFALVTLLNCHVIRHHGVQFLHDTVAVFARDGLAFAAEVVLADNFSTMITDDLAIAEHDLH